MHLRTLSPGGCAEARDSQKRCTPCPAAPELAWSRTIATSQVTHEMSGKGAVALRRISPRLPPYKTGEDQRCKKKNEA